MRAAALGSTFQRMTVSALRKALNKAGSAGDTSIKRGGSYAGLDLLRSILADAEDAATGKETTISTQSADPQSTIHVRDFSLGPIATTPRSPSAHDEGNVQADLSAAKRPQANVSELVSKKRKSKGNTSRSLSSKRSKTDGALEQPDTEQSDSAQSDHSANGALQRKSHELASVSNLLTFREMQKMQVTDFGEEEIAAFEQVVKRFEMHLRARDDLGTNVCRSTLGKHEVPRKKIDKKDGKGISHTSPSGVYQPKPLSDEHIAALKGTLPADLSPMLHKLTMIGALGTPPRYLYRASSWEGKKHTGGYDTRTLHGPAAHMNDDEKCHDSIYEIPHGLFELVEMLGHRFLWLDRRRDETLSWTSSLLFALVHATDRLAKGQRYVVIHVTDTTKVTTIDDSVE